MPRVLRIINRLNLGGPSYNAAYLTKFLEPAFETLLISGMKDEREESSEFIPKDLGLHPLYIRSMYRELDLLADYKSYRELKKIIKKFRPDIVHTHAAKAGAIGRLAAIDSNVPVVVHTFHGHVFHSYFNKFKTQAFIKIERYLAKRTDKIITLSPAQKRELSLTYKIAEDEKFEIIPLGLNLEKFREDQAEKRQKFRSEYQIREDEVAIGIIGRLVPIKNHTLFLKAIKSVMKKADKKLRAFIIGDGEERVAIEQTAMSLGLCGQSKKEDILTFTSWRKDIDVCTAGLDIIALTSNNEGTPVSLIEAQAAGKPIVCTNVGGVKDVVLKDETALISERGNLNEFQENLFRLVQEDDLRQKFSQTGWEFVNNRFSYTRLCRDTSLLYSRLLDNAKGRTR